MTRGRSSSLCARALAVLGLGVGFACGYAATGCGMWNAVVGGECVSGFALCGDVCVDIESDGDNCGGCGNVCSARAECGAGRCRAPVDGGAQSSATSSGSHCGGGGGAYDDANDDGADDADGSSADDGPSEDATAEDGAVEGG